MTTEKIKPLRSAAAFDRTSCRVRLVCVPWPSFGFWPCQTDACRILENVESFGNLWKFWKWESPRMAPGAGRGSVARIRNRLQSYLFRAGASWLTYPGRRRPPSSSIFPSARILESFGKFWKVLEIFGNQPNLG